MKKCSFRKLQATRQPFISSERNQSKQSTYESVDGMEVMQKEQNAFGPKQYNIELIVWTLIM